MKILIVDDFEMIRVMLKGQLNSMGITNIDQAKDGKEALDLIMAANSSNSLYDVVFCDWNMPVMTGIEVLETCKAHPEIKEMPIIMVTAESERGHVVRALKSGASDYLIKPIAPVILQKKISTLIEKLNLKSA